MQRPLQFALAAAAGLTAAILLPVLASLAMAVIAAVLLVALRLYKLATATASNVWLLEAANLPMWLASRLPPSPAAKSVANLQQSKGASRCGSGRDESRKCSTEQCKHACWTDEQAREVGSS